ncbi:hypothetical protein GC177_05125 [bacterium]|nr:hypothetical protein [bacterium]
MLLRLGGVGLQLAMFVWLAHRATPVDVGLYAMVNGFWMVARFVGPLGWDHTLLRDIPACLTQQREGQAAALERFAFRRVLLTNLLIGLLCGLGVMFWPAKDLPIHTPLLATATALGIMAYGIIGLGASQLRARHEQLWPQLPEMLLLPGIALALWLPAGAVGTLDGTQAVWLQSCAAIFCAGLHLWRYLRRYYRRNIRLEPHLAREAAALTHRMFATALLTGFSSRAPVLLVPLVLGLAATALMETAMRFTMPLMLCGWGATMVVSPMLSALHAEKKKQELHQIFALGAWLAFIPAVIGLVLLMLFGKWLLAWLMGPSYLPAYNAMLLLALAWVVNASTGMASRLFMMTGHERVTLLFSLIQALILAFGVPLGARWQGVEGAAFAVLIATLFRDGGLNMLVRRYVGIGAGVWSREGWRAGLELPNLLREALRRRA